MIPPSNYFTAVPSASLLFNNHDRHLYSRRESATMSSFSDLPAETLLELAKFLPTSSCLALSRTCSTLHNTLTPSLYENVHVTSKPSQGQHPISTLELFYAKMLRSQRKRRLVKTFAVSWAGESLKERDQAMIALLIDILPKVVIFQFRHLGKVNPKDIQQHSIQGMDSTSLDLPDRRLQIHQSRYPVRDELVPLGSSSPRHLIWGDTVSPPKDFADFVRPLRNIKTLRLHPTQYSLCDSLDRTALPRLKNVSASLRVAFRLLYGRRIRRLRTWLDFHYKDNDTLLLESERAFIGDMENLEVLEIESMHPVDSCIVPYGTKLKFLRISSNLFITRDVVDQLFNDIPTLECIEWAMEHKMYTSVLGKSFYYGTRKYRDVPGLQNVQWMCPFDEEWLGDWKKDVRPVTVPSGGTLVKFWHHPQYI
ncbi:hypothetical protein EYR40_006129 [Pleurotus pulmonarius]|nr:hypothetical protein EYR36_010752 [Pleurotus pulmonarius]KAF4599040.1 hypothetical protein EYR40_006129 [Pleurotus pulmonarius]